MSALDWDFSSQEHDKVPRALLRDWATLIEELAHVFDETFHVPPIPDDLEFHKELIHSDWPYPSDENYYTLDSYSYLLEGEDGRGLRLDYEKYRQGSHDGISLDTVKASTPISSCIYKKEKAPLAYIHIVSILRNHSQAQRDAADAAIRRHHRLCGGGD